MKKLAVLPLLILLSACATQTRITETPSGMPEIVIRTTDKQAIKNNLIARNAQSGWFLERETDSTLFFTYVDDSGSFRSALTQALIGNAYSTPPKYEANYLLFPAGEGAYKVQVQVSVSTQMAMGQVNRVSLKDNVTVFNGFQRQLQKVKQEIEAAEEAQPPAD